MQLAFALFLWVGLSVAAHVYLRRIDRTPSSIMAGLMAAGLGIAGLLQFQFPRQIAVAGDTYHDTYFTLGLGYFLLIQATYYLFAAIVAFLSLRLARGWVRQMMAPSFWLLHIGSGATLVPTLLARFQMPTRYADYPDAFRWHNLTTSVGTLIGFLGLIGLAVLIAVVLGQRAFSGRTN